DSLALARRIDLAIDGSDEGLVGRASHLPEFLDRDHSRRACRLAGVRAVRLDEVGKGPARLAQVHTRQAEADLVAGAPQVALGSAGGRGSEGRRVEDVYIGRAILRGDEAGEVETRVLHDDWCREHGPAWRIAVAAAHQRSEGNEKGGAAHA